MPHHASDRPRTGPRIRAVITAVVVVAVLVIGMSVAMVHLRGRFGAGPSSPTTASPATGTSVQVDNIVSPVDFNGNGVDDYSDIVAGARADAEAMPTYDDSYYVGGYPPDDRGACTDLVWRAFRRAGYSLKDMVDADVAAHPEHYPSIGAPDPNIDFRRAGTLDGFFSAYGQSLTLDVNDVEQWQPGDIVIFENGVHVGIVSNKRDERGIPLLLHNNRQRQREEDYLSRGKRYAITGHYRFDASQVPQDVLKAWS